ncbi:unnamed protein product, partial [Anisakis simplex]|uniref:RALGAPB_N domain-containing protein n=1 Tax=Anisakis simplex TaxID=6269 RepID=A0A0M3IYR2_ANISI
MYEEWPLLEFRSLQHTSTLTLFSKGAGEYVAEVLMKEILENAEASVADSWHVETEEQLSWLMQVISYALTLSYSPSREYEALRAAVRTYVIWLSALINESHPSVPKPLKQNPQKYTSEMIDALRLIFTRHTTAACSESSSTHHSLNSLTVLGQSCTAAAASAHQQLSESDQIHITRQSQQMQIILKAITTLNSNCKSVHRDWVCAKSLHFLMNVADLLLSGQLSTPDEISAVMAPKMSLTLFDEFLFAARAELIPSPSYWRTLSVLCKRWRHQVPVLENWARKVLSLSVLIVQEMFGTDYCSVKIVDDEVKEFVKFVGRRAEDESYSVLHVCWFEMLHLIGNPANIVTFEPCAVGAVPHTPIQALLATGLFYYYYYYYYYYCCCLSDDKQCILLGGKMDSDGRPLVTGLGDEMSAYTASKLRQCFFLACAAISKLVDIFYGDCKVSVEFRESEELMRQWAECNRANYDEWLKHQQMIQRSASGSVNTNAGGGDSGTLTAANIQQMQTTSSAASTLNPAMTTATSVTTSGGGTSSSNILKNAFGLQSSSHSHTSKTRAVSERSLQTQSAQVHSGGGESPPELAKPTASQFVWNYLKSNAIERRETKLQQQQHSLGEQPGPSTGAMLDMFMDWLVKSALIKPLTTTSTSTVHYRQSGGADRWCFAALSDVGSQRSMSSFGVDENQLGESGEGMAAGYTSTSDSAVTRRSFGQSTTSSSEAQWLTAPTEWPGVDGVSAGRAAAIGALCRIICSKNSLETLADCQLAQFYKVVHEALLEKDRLILCSVIYFGENMFRLGLKGIEVLLPLFVVAIDIVLPESTKLRLHPSISEVEMRRACLRALSSILSWPTVFGCARIADPSHVSFSSSGYSIAEGHSQSYIELRPRIHRILIYSLRHETDPANLHLTLAMCNILCEESCVYDMCFTAERLTRQQDESKASEGAEKDGGYYCVSLLKTVVYEICENMCKALWCSELSVCLAAIDCINSITNIHPNILFYRKDLSTGFSIVTSLCRFIDTQLQKPPPQHSRDLHSSVVAAYMSLAVWLCAAPQLVETESCLTTIAETIEFGIYGGKNLAVPQRKAASKRVHDAAEF